ncbi:MAG: aldehyde dehydrogenase family protein, partial [Pseudobdellovibrio sp.]
MNSQQFSALKERAQVFRSDTVSIRRDRLEKLLDWMTKNEDEIYAALKQDFNKPHFETLISEINPCTTELRYAIKKLKCWMKDQRVGTPMALFGHSSVIRYENKGVVLVIGPWNYPFQLAVVPMISALAAGNTVVIKPSEFTPHTSRLIKKMAEDCFYANEVFVEEGGKEKTEELLKYNFDHVFFTGSTAVGRVISSACASRLIPVTLELGGKSPTIVDETADLDEAAFKIFWSKFLNRAQTCVAPDYLILHHSIAEKLISKLKDLTEKHKADEKARIISDKHLERLQKLAGQNVDFNKVPLVLLPLTDIKHPSMQEEIFGPVLPYFSYKNFEDISQIVLPEEKPLSFYIFSKNKSNIETLLKRYPSGNVGINTVVVQFSNHHLPFGGVGAS